MENLSDLSQGGAWEIIMLDGISTLPKLNRTMEVPQVKIGHSTNEFVVFR